MAEENRDNAGVIAPPPLMFFACLGAGLLLYWLYPAEIVSAWSGARLVLALGLFALGGLVAVPAMLLFRREKNPVDPARGATALIIRGPFRRTRNPMYLALMLTMAAAFLITGSAWLLLFGLALYLLLLFGVIKREERYMEAKFGDQYRAYAASVRRWL